MPRFQQRRERLRRLVRKAGAEAILVTNFTNVSYLTGFTGDDSYLLVASSGQVLLTDTRYTEQLAEECPGLDLDVRRSGVRMLDRIKTVVAKAKLANLAIEADSMTVGLFEQLDKEVGVVLAPTSGLVEGLREIKDKEEVAAIRRAVALAERAFAVVRAGLRPDRTEAETAHELEQQVRAFGGAGRSFDTIVAVGDRAALPHARPTQRLLGDSDFVLIDWGARENRYVSDLTRVLATGKISPKLERIYGVVLNAQERAINSIKPGVAMKDVDAVARTIIEKAGYGKRFGHGLGHGIGLEIHEAPRLASNVSRLLTPGMVVTVEPGIYLPGWGGVRIEDDVLVTRDGHEVLSAAPKAFADCIVNTF